MSTPCTPQGGGCACAGCPASRATVSFKKRLRASFGLSNDIKPMDTPMSAPISVIPAQAGTQASTRELVDSYLGPGLRRDDGSWVGDSISARSYQWLRGFITTPGRAFEFVRYTGVSGASLALDITLFRMLLKAGSSPALAGAESCIAGLLLHYALSVTLVFDAKKTGKSQTRLIGEYALTGLMGFVLSAGSIFLVVNIAGGSPGLGKLLGVGVTFVSVYLVRAGILFAPRREAQATFPPFATSH